MLDCLQIASFVKVIAYWKPVGEMIRLKQPNAGSRIESFKIKMNNHRKIRE